MGGSELLLIITIIGIKLNRTDSYLLLLIIHILNVLTKPFVSVFTVSLSYENILSQNSQSTCRSLYRKGLNSAWSLNFTQNLINGWVLINKGSENSSLNKQVFSLYTLKSCLWKLQVILLNRVYSGSSIILTYTGYTTVMSFNN